MAYKSVFGFFRNKRLTIRRTKGAAERLHKTTWNRHNIEPVQEFVLVPKEDYEKLIKFKNDFS